MATVLLFAAPVSGSVPRWAADPFVMVVGLIIVLGMFAWIWTHN